jgi:hypothetical protein
LTNIGKISRISIRDEFPDEARNFTPWLKENLHYIGEKLHLSFNDDSETEVSVGRYSCDVMAHTSDGQRVVIENQFGHADHDHLGKILTYASGLDADILIWIAEDFLPEHITALNWLNSITSEETPSFFAIKIGLIKIDDSKPALEVNTVVSPDQWARQVKTSRITRERTGKRQKYYEFWSHFIPFFDSIKTGFKNRTPPDDNWINFPAPISKMHYTFYFEGGKNPGIALYIDGGTTDENKELFDKIQTHQSELNTKFPDLEWYDNPGNKSKSINFYKNDEYDFGEESRKEVMEWFSHNMKFFESTFNPIIKNL